jgi:hypothetical protein
MFALSEFDIRYQTSSQKELILISQHSLCVHGLCILMDRLVKTDPACVASRGNAFFFSQVAWPMH